MNKVLKEKIDDNSVYDYDVVCSYMHDSSLKFITFYYKDKGNEYMSLTESRNLINKNKGILYSVRNPFK